MAKKTSVADDTLAGQRRINLVWEITQSSIVFAITGAVIVMALKEIENQSMIIAFFTIITAYLTRTNHQAIGGTGPKATDDQKYVGR